jgi:hypothetical protein
MRQARQAGISSITRIATCFLLALAAAGSAGAAVAPSGTAGSARARVTTPSLKPASRLRLPSREEMRQFYAELKREGWEGAQVAAIHTGYAKTEAGLKTTGTHFATLYGDLDGDQRPEWVVGCYVPSRPGSASEPQTGMSGMMPVRGAGSGSIRDDRARVAIFKRSNDAWRLNWISPGLGYEFHAPDYNVQEVNAGLEQIETLGLPLALLDVDRDGRPEITYQCWSESPVIGALPGIYRYDGTRWIGIAPQADRFSVQDVDRDGKMEVITGSRYVGYGTGDDDVPHVWRWNGRRYQEASSDFPTFFSALAVRYRKTLSRKEQKGEAFDRAAWERAIRKAASLAG